MIVYKLYYNNILCDSQTTLNSYFNCASFSRYYVQGTTDERLSIALAFYR